MRAIITGALAAIVAFAYLGWQGMTLANLESKGIRAEGQIVRWKDETHFNGSDRSAAGYFGETNYHPIVEFRTQANQTIEFEDFFGEYLPIFRPPSRTVTVLYLPSNPHSSAIIDRGTFWNWVRLAISPMIYFR